jgi:peptidoglycan-associated lipoprotein
MKSCWMKTRTFIIFVAIGLGLGACSNAALKDQTSVTSSGLSQANEATTTGGVNKNDSHISSFFDITYFDFDSAELSANTRKVLDKAVDKFLTNPSWRVVISGHADERGTREYNLALGHLRASAVADYMVANGIDGLRIKKISFGKEKPLLKGSNEEAWSKNRRVEINGE